MDDAYKYLNLTRPFKIIVGACALYQRETKLYRRFQMGWGSYCKTVLKRDRSSVYDYMAAAVIWEFLEGKTDVMSDNHSQALAMMKVLPDRRAETWCIGVEKTGGEAPSADLIKTIATELGALDPRALKPSKKPVHENTKTDPASSPTSPPIANAGGAVALCEDLENYLSSRNEQQVAKAVGQLKFFIERHADVGNM